VLFRSTHTHTHTCMVSLLLLLYGAPRMLLMLTERVRRSMQVGLKISTCVVAMVMATVGNALVLLTILFNRHRLVTVSIALYMVNLAISDFMVGAFVMWIHLASSIQQDWPFGSTLCQVYPFLQCKHARQC